MGNGIAWCVNPDGTNGESWNPVVGCSAISPGCAHCWAATFASRGLSARHKGLAEKGRWITPPRFIPEALDVPLRRRKPTGYAVCLMGDLFHEAVTDEQIAAVFGVMAACPQHRFYVLTKRAARMERWFGWARDRRGNDDGFGVLVLMDALREVGLGREGRRFAAAWPLPNVWLLVSVENQKAAEERVPHLLRCPAAVHGVSMEPLLEAVDLDRGRCETHDREHVQIGPDGEFCGECAANGYSGELTRGHWLDDIDEDTGQPMNGPGIGWVIVGGESGPHARPFDLAWARSLRDQCRAAGVPWFCKQLGACASDPPNGIAGRSLRVPDEALPLVSLRLRHPAGADPAEWPADLRVREMPRAD